MRPAVFGKLMFWYSSFRMGDNLTGAAGYPPMPSPPVWLLVGRAVLDRNPDIRHQDAPVCHFPSWRSQLRTPSPAPISNICKTTDSSLKPRQP